jgi:hypothetical protein
MPVDLVVPADGQVQLDAQPAGELAEAFTAEPITRLRDLIELGVVGEDAANSMLDAAKQVTDVAIRRTGTVRRTVIGSLRPDLGRFGEFSLRAPGTPADQSVFWRTVRDVPPRTLADLDLDSDIGAHLPLALQILRRFRFRDVTVEPDGRLICTTDVHGMVCNHLLIRSGGLIIVRGAAFRIKAESIQGE